MDNTPKLTKSRLSLRRKAMSHSENDLHTCVLSTEAVLWQNQQVCLCPSERWSGQVSNSSRVQQSGKQRKIICREPRLFVVESEGIADTSWWVQAYRSPGQDQNFLSDHIYSLWSNSRGHCTCRGIRGKLYVTRSGGSMTKPKVSPVSCLDMVKHL